MPRPPPDTPLLLRAISFGVDALSPVLVGHLPPQPQPSYVAMTATRVTEERHSPSAPPGPPPPSEAQAQARRLTARRVTLSQVSSKRLRWNRWTRGHGHEEDLTIASSRIHRYDVSLLRVSVADAIARSTSVRCLCSTSVQCSRRHSNSARRRAVMVSARCMRRNSLNARRRPKRSSTVSSCR